MRVASTDHDSIFMVKFMAHSKTEALKTHRECQLIDQSL